MWQNHYVNVHKDKANVVCYITILITYLGQSPINFLRR